MSSSLKDELLTSTKRSSVEEYATILLVGVAPRGVPSLLHLEKEIFMVTRAIKVLRDAIPFKQSELGPYSKSVRHTIHSGYLHQERVTGRISITLQGMKEYESEIDDLKERFSPDEFDNVMLVFKSTRDFLDKLTDDELLLLIYSSYPDYVIKSAKYEQIEEDREKISEGLLGKGLITKDRYEELTGKLVA